MSDDFITRLTAMATALDNDGQLNAAVYVREALNVAEAGRKRIGAIEAALKDVLPLLEYLSDEADPENDCSEVGAVCASAVCRETGCVSMRFWSVHKALGTNPKSEGASK